MANGAGRGAVAAFFHAGRAAGHCVDLDFQPARPGGDLSKRGHGDSGLCIRYAALGWTTVARAARAADRSLADAARLEGATFLANVAPCLLAANSAQLAAAWYCDLAALSVGRGNAGVDRAARRREPWRLRIFNLLHYGHNPQVNALCLWLMALALLPLLLAGRFGLGCGPSGGGGPGAAALAPFFSSSAVPATSGEALPDPEPVFQPRAKSSARAAPASGN